jgi:hypothetical protein
MEPDAAWSAMGPSPVNSSSVRENTGNEGKLPADDISSDEKGPKPITRRGMSTIGRSAL